MKVSEREVQHCIQASSDPRPDTPGSGSDLDPRSGASSEPGSESGAAKSSDCDSRSSPLNTERLRPIRQRTKNVVVSTKMYLEYT